MRAAWLCFLLVAGSMASGASASGRLGCTGQTACVTGTCKDKVTAHEVTWDEGTGRLAFLSIGYPSDTRQFDLLDAHGAARLTAVGAKDETSPFMSFVLFDTGAFHMSVHSYLKGLSATDTGVVTLFGTCDMEGLS